MAHHVPKPEELQGVPSDVLESYVRARLLATASHSIVGQKLGLPKETIRQAFAYVLAENSASLQRLASSPRNSEGYLQLTFGHNCQNLGCNAPRCLLCAQNPNRRCSRTFSQKYLAGDVLKSHCGASIKVTVEDRASLDPAQPDGIDLEVCILDGRAYEALQSAQREHDEAEVEKCILPTNNQGKELLVPTRGGHHNEEKWVVFSFSKGQAYLPDLTVTGSSEALLSGQKPPFRLLVRAVNSKDGSRATNIRFVVSDDFVVATPRVRTAAKADIPHLDDHVSKLHSIGNMTQTKLQDIQAAANAAGIFRLKVPHNCVTKVGQFKELVEVAEQDPQLCESLKKVLKLTRGWEIARDHANTAVVTDNQMRVWTDPNAEGASTMSGLLFKCQLGSTDLENPVGLLSPKERPEGLPAVMEPTLVDKLAASGKEMVKKLLKKAISCWWQDGHPGWSIWPIDSDRFLQEMTGVNHSTLTPEHLITTQSSPQREARPVTRASALAQQMLETKPLQTSSESSSDKMSNGAAGQNQPVQNWGLRSVEEERPHQAFLQPSDFPRSAAQTSLGMDLFSQNHTASQHQMEPLELGGRNNANSWGRTESLTRPNLPYTETNGRQAPEWRNTFRLQEDGNGFGGSFSNRQLQPSNGLSGRPGSFENNFSTVNDYSQQHSWNFQGLGIEGMSQQGQSSGRRQEMPPLPRQHNPSEPFNRPAFTQLSGFARKRDSDLAPRPQSGNVEGNPLPSPFGMAFMQDLDIPVKTTQSALSHPQQIAPIHTRQSSGIEPASAKRRHLSPQALQQGLSSIFGHALDTEDMSKLLPNFSELLDRPFSEKDLPSMPLASHNLPLLMDSMLDHKQHGAQLMAVLEGDANQRSLPSTHPMQGSILPNLPQGIDFTYGDLSEAVDLASRDPQERGNGLTEQRNSQLLAEYLTARNGLQNGMINFNGNDPSRVDPGIEISEQRKSGLDTMKDIDDALPLR